jgi:hypothetical protein
VERQPTLEEIFLAIVGSDKAGSDKVGSVTKEQP